MYQNKVNELANKVPKFDPYFFVASAEKFLIELQ
jgi:hypothetical protein